MYANLTHFCTSGIKTTLCSVLNLGLARTLTIYQEIKVSQLKQDPLETSWPAQCSTVWANDRCIGEDNSNSPVDYRSRGITLGAVIETKIGDFLVFLVISR